MSTPSDQFNVTQWTKVLRAGQGDLDGRAALSDLCAAYWKPVHRFLRSEGRSEDMANELTQEFFAKILRAGNIGSVDPNKGKFRTYLLGAVKHFLRDERVREQSQKRGGGQTLEPLPEEITEAGSPRLANPVAPTSDAYFDREWAVQVLDRSLNALGTEMKVAGRGVAFETLKPWLTGETGRPTQAEIASQLNQSEGSIKVTIHRLRQRFRELVRTEIATTLAVGEEVEQELNYLVRVLSV
jgi:RNA polymerase sigma-70 factor (ECF subfamily)